MAEVYRAHDEKLQRDAAIRVLPPGNAADPQASARLVRQLQRSGTDARSVLRELGGVPAGKFSGSTTKTP
jgi:hypothetical protein